MRKIFLFNAVIIGAGAFLGMAASQQGKPSAVPVQAEYKNKIVYTSERLEDTSALKEDCRQRGGKFLECGSLCDDSRGPVNCAGVCAYVCLLNSESKDDIHEQNH